MGDLRFQPSYLRVRDAANRIAALRALSDKEVVEALAGASAQGDPLFANFLATEAVNRLGRARRVLEHIREGVIATDRSGHITMLNHAAERILGWTHAEAAGLMLDEMLRAELDVTEGGARVVDLLQQGAKPDGLRIDNAHVCGRWYRRVAVSLRAVPIYFGSDVAGVVITMEDVGPLHTARAAKDALLALSEGLEDGLIGTNADGRVVIWNPACERLYGFSDQEAVGSFVRDLIFPADRWTEDASIREALQRGQPVRETDTERVRKDGSRIRVSLTVLPVRDDDGHVTGSISLQRPLTSRGAGLGGVGDR